MKKFTALLMAAVMLLAVAIPSVLAEEPKAEYTYNSALSSFPTNWSPFQNQTNTDNTAVLDWISTSFYTFDYNEEGDSYQLKPLAAVGEPEDVTADYVGEEWNIPEFVADADGNPTEEKTSARAWKITLRDDLKWEDGTPITANDYVDSWRLLLDSKAQNHRADGMYTGNMVVTNAELFAKQGTTADTSVRSYMELLGVETIEELIEQIGEEKGYLDWEYSFGDTYDFEAKAWTGAAEGGIVETPLTFKELYEFYTVGAGGEYITWADEAGKKEYALDELYAKYQYPEMDPEKLGVKALSDTELVVILEKPLSGFYLLYSFTSDYLVNKELYEKCGKEEDGVYTNNYGTSLETTMSYGPYKLVEFQPDKQIVLVKNENWFGYEANIFGENSYQTTRMVTQYVAEPATRLEMFLAGQLDAYGLQRDDMVEYGTSDFTYYSEGDSVFAMVFNPDMEALKANQEAAGENKNKTILTIKEFRIGMSLGLNRADFCAATSPTNQPAFALYGGQIVADPETATFYRNTEVAKQTVVDFWGLTDEVGEGKTYATLDDAIDSLTGYNLEMAKQNFDAAYDIAIAEGLMDEDDVVEILIGTPNMTSAFYNAGYDFIVNNYTEAVKGTKLEGKLTFERDGTLGNNFGTALRTNQVDMLFGVGWTGSTFDPYGLFQVYVSPTYQYDSSWDSTTAMVDIAVDGVVYTASASDWWYALSGEQVNLVNKETGETVSAAYPDNKEEGMAERRISILGALENAVLQNYHFIPLMGDASAALKGMKIEYYTEDEIFPMGRGGVRYMTYNYTDAEWDAFVKEHGGILNYK